MYNPVSMKIEDPKRLADRELRERKKKARYELKYGVEDDTRIRGMEDYDKDQLQKMNRMNYKRYVDYLERGFDILTNTNFDSAEMKNKIYQPRVTAKPKVWDIIEYQKNNPESISSSQIHHDIKPLSVASQKENVHSELEPLSRKSSEAYAEGNPTQIKTQLTSIVRNSDYKHTKTPNRTRSGSAYKALNKSVFSQVGAEHVASHQSNSSNRRIRTGAFQKVAQ